MTVAQKPGRKMRKRGISPYERRLKKRLAKLRKDSQKSIADCVRECSKHPAAKFIYPNGMSWDTWASWEKLDDEQGRLPPIGALPAIAKTLQCTVKDLMP